MCKLYLEKGRGTRDQIANICWIIEKAREFQKNSYFCFLDYTKIFVWITTNCGKFLKDGNTRPLYLPPEKSVCKLRSNSQNHIWNNRVVPNWEKRTSKAIFLSPCLFNFYAEYIMQKARLDQAQSGIKIAGRNINNLRYAYDTNFMARVSLLFFFFFLVLLLFFF